METPTKKRKINKSEKSEEYFVLVNDQNGIKTYQCNECKKKVNCTKRSNLTSHLRIHPDIIVELCRENQSIEAARLKLLLDCIELVGVNGRPFKSLNDSAIHSMNYKLLAELKAAGRDLNLRDNNLTEVKNELMKISQEIREKISKEVKNRPISVLVDIVTKRGRSILGVSIQHMIKDVVKVRSIGMIELEQRHTGKYLADLIIERLQQLGINLKQLITITTDNGSNVLKMVRDVAEHLKKSIDEANNPSTLLNVNRHIQDDMRNVCCSAAEENIDIEIEKVLANDDELTDDEAIALIVREAEIADTDFELTEEELLFNQNLLNEMQNNMENISDFNVIWDVMGINCIVHTLQLAISDSLKSTTNEIRNLIDLCRCVAKYLRLYGTICDLQENGITYNKPHVDVITRWGSLYQMMITTLSCKNAIVYLGEKNYKAAQLLRRKWNDLKELISILQIPYKATIALQRQDLTLSDAFGIWLKMNAHLESPPIKRLCKTNFAGCLINALHQRKQSIFNNSAMLSAIYLDPRFRYEICSNQDLREQAQQKLANLWYRLVSLRPELANQLSTNCSTESSGINLSIDFNNPKILDEYLSKEHPPDSQQIDCSSVNIEHEIEQFQPEKLACDETVLSYWKSVKDEKKNLYELAMIIYAIPPAETQIERDFSLLEFIFNQRRQGLRTEMIEAILTINLNHEIFFEIKKEKLEACELHV